MNAALCVNHSHTLGDNPFFGLALNLKRKRLKRQRFQCQATLRGQTATPLDKTSRLKMCLSPPLEALQHRQAANIYQVM